MFEAGKVTTQLPLAINLNDEATFTGFCWNGNENLQKQLLTTLSGTSHKLFYLWGENGCGKSHLLQACCQYTSSQNQSAIYFPLKLLKEYGHQILDGIDSHDLICLDDLDSIAGDKQWEEAIFHLYNRIRDQGEATLIMASQVSPSQTPVKLPDLKSRLIWGLVWQVQELNDNDKVCALQLLATKRGFAIPESVCHYLINRCARNMHDLHDLLNKLDEASLIAQRKITIPFVKSILKI
ncbi:MAG: DnaA regulatory inactivator Hda [Legionellaceae bacterium]|nr:DnaA regulatory inactivator Hda [Legionellaceae bacterium]